MPNDYGLVRKARKNPKIVFGQGMKRVETPEPENKSKITVETPGVNDETQKGAYSDRIKIEPKFSLPPRQTPRPSDTEIHKMTSNSETKI